MNTRSIVFAGIAACGSVAAFLGACASDEGGPSVEPAEDAMPAPAPDGDLDAPAAEASADACVDCEYFPETCSEDVLCPNGPFDRSLPDALDWRTQIVAVRGRSVTDVWAVGANGTVVHFDGTSWARSESGTREALRALWLRDSEEIAIGTQDSLYTRGLEMDAAPSSGGWNAYGAPSHSPEVRDYDYYMKVTSAWAAPGAEGLWFTATASTRMSGLWRLRRPSPSALELGPGVPPQACATFPCSQMTSVHGISANDVWAVGWSGATIRVNVGEDDAPRITRYNSQTWYALRGVWASSDAEAWSVGVRGTLRHYTGDPLLWDVVSDVPTTEDLNAVWGSSPSDVWVVGNAGVVLHYDGASWSRVKIAGLGARRPDLTTVWMPAPGHVWVGGQGVILSLGGKP